MPRIAAVRYDVLIDAGYFKHQASTHALQNGHRGVTSHQVKVDAPRLRQVLGELPQHHTQLQGRELDRIYFFEGERDDRLPGMLRTYVSKHHDAFVAAGGPGLAADVLAFVAEGGAFEASNAAARTSERHYRHRLEKNDLIVRTGLMTLDREKLHQHVKTTLRRMSRVPGATKRDLLREFEHGLASLQAKDPPLHQKQVDTKIVIEMLRLAEHPNHAFLLFGNDSDLAPGILEARRRPGRPRALILAPPRRVLAKVEDHLFGAVDRYSGVLRMGSEDFGRTYTITPRHGRKVNR